MDGHQIVPPRVAQTGCRGRGIHDVAEQQRRKHAIGPCTADPLAHAGPFDRDGILVADRPPHMAGRDVVEVARPELVRRPVHHSHGLPSRDHGPDMMGLAPCAPDERLEVRVPVPAHGLDRPRQSKAAQRDQLLGHTPELDRLVRLIETPLDLHVSSPPGRCATRRVALEFVTPQVSTGASSLLALPAGKSDGELSHLNRHVWPRPCPERLPAPGRVAIADPSAAVIPVRGTIRH